MSNISNYQCIQGDDWNFTATVRSGGDVVDLTGAKAWFTVKVNVDDADEDAVIQIVIEGSLTTDGKIPISVPHNETDIDLATYFYDIQVKLPGNIIKTVKRGQLEVVWQATLSN